MAGILSQPQPSESRQRLRFGWVQPLIGGMGVLLGAVTLLALWFALAQPVKVMPRIRTMPAFLITNQDGQPAGDAELRGRLVLMNFSYTRCGAECADLDKKLQQVQAALAPPNRLGREIMLATISLDPAHDTPEVLRAYAAQLGARPSDWFFLTGAPAEIKGLVGGELGIYYEQPDAAGHMEHDDEVLLIDEHGILRARYTPETLTTDRLSRDLGLMDQERTSSGVMRQVYEVSHLFLCYPT
ncbi:MAG: SCO family protein [Oscillochloris sp.]|nr:SCO family protein [Oscillochloris sp.]